MIRLQGKALCVRLPTYHLFHRRAFNQAGHSGFDDAHQVSLQISKALISGVLSAKLHLDPSACWQMDQIDDHGPVLAKLDKTIKEAVTSLETTRAEFPADVKVQASCPQDFSPTHEWQLVPMNAICPPGLHFKLDVGTGQTHARLAPINKIEQAAD